MFVCLLILIDAYRSRQQLWSFRDVAFNVCNFYPKLGCHAIPNNNHPRKPLTLKVHMYGWFELKHTWWAGLDKSLTELRISVIRDVIMTP